jgi:hypothetical protein
VPSPATRAFVFGKKMLVFDGSWKPGDFTDAATVA